MSQVWADRQRRTNGLVRAIGAHILNGEPDGNQLLGLSRLTWITTAYDGENPAYVKSTKIPGLADALRMNLDGMGLDEVAELVAAEVQSLELAELVRSHTGFTNFYKAYRNSASGWAHQNREALSAIFRRALTLESDDDARDLTSLIAVLPLIPKAKSPGIGMRPEYLVTPVCFALDARVRYPIINGAAQVKLLLRRMGVANANLMAQHQALVGMIGQGGIADAADLDQLELADQIDLVAGRDEPLRHLLQEKDEEYDDLPSKDEGEIARLQLALTTAQRRLHNQMTNRLRRILAHWTLLEGRAEDCRYDVLVRNYDEDGNDLLIEVKSSTDASQVRMAIGQVLSYWHRLKRPADDPHVAILLPSRPDERTADLLDWLEIGLMWFEGERLHTRTDWLHPVAERADEW